jgi:hypothetical protein
MLNEVNQMCNFISTSGSETIINYGSGSDFLTSYGFASQNVLVSTVPVPVPQRTELMMAFWSSSFTESAATDTEN